MLHPCIPASPVVPRSAPKPQGPAMDPWEPPKTNMVHLQMDLMEKEIPALESIISGFHVEFQGVLAPPK